MNTILRWILSHPVFVFITTAVMVFIGGLSLWRLPVEIRPEQETQRIQISAHWGRQTPETVQRVITMPLEDMVTRLKNVSSVESTSGVGYSLVILTFPPAANLKYAYIELQERVAMLRESLPRDLRLSIEPYFSDSEEDLAQKSSFFKLELAGPSTLNQVRRLADEQVVPALKGLEGIGGTRVFGGSRLYIKVDLNPVKLRMLNLQATDIRRAINVNIERKGLGVVHYSGNRFLLVFDEVPEEVPDLANIPVLPANHRRIGDVASVNVSYERPVTLSRHNFNPLVTIDVYKAAGANALKFSGKVRSLLKGLRTKLPKNMKLRIVRDNANDLHRELQSLLFRAGIILAVVFVVLLILFRRFFLSGIILSVVFLSLLGGTILLYFTGYTINVVTLAGIALVFGMLVDNAVVVIENIHRLEQESKGVAKSAIQGTVEVFQPMIAATATTLLVFFSLFLLKERLGNYYRPLAFALGFSLFASLILALTLIPAIYTRLRLKRKLHNKWISEEISNQAGAIFLKLRSVYQKLIRWNLRHRIFIYSLLAGTFCIAGYLFLNKVPRGEFYSWQISDELRVYVNAPRGVTLEVLDNIARAFENLVKASGINCDVQTVVSAPSANARIQITFPDSVKFSMKPYLLKERLIALAVNFAGVGIYIGGFGEGFYNGGYEIRTFYNSRLEIVGPQYNRLWEICESILETAKRSPRVSEGVITTSRRGFYSANMKEITLSTGLRRLWDDGWTWHDLTEQLSPYLFRQSGVEEIPVSSGRLPLRITVGNEIPQLSEIRETVLQTPGGKHQRVADLLNITRSSASMWIDKQNQQYRFIIRWEYRGPPEMSSAYKRRIVESLSLPPGYKLVKSEWSFLTREEESSLIKLFVIVAAGIYMILAVLYESFRRPLVIFLSVPFSLIGIFLAYWLFGRTFDINGYIGLILLSGIVVNNAIILVDRIFQLEREGIALVEAIVRGTLQRIRPIFITTITTIGGLFPLLFLRTEESFLSEILEELSFVTISGLLGSTLLTIILIPLVYYSIEKFSFRWNQ